ncbi:TIGR02444 family protein [Pseudomonas turukhanskensis]|uniref:TIGR02444 family protein n=1 Tax=Pseudomonas turukhanskensis TaxID=1806536 RepID=A0A9W6K3I9_9PSED|nr:TIGR02444 family protein [Pseudomonas turukhanskensis]GLK87576.1 TIGR02444 family protein [Pseudomonas turukhanskensis]
MPSDLWSFAQNLYARPGIESACLQLQQHGADVCVLLSAAWLQQRGIACTPARAAALRALAEPWQSEVITPLRQLRKGWREAAGHDEALRVLREQIKALELQAEQQLLERLQQATTDWLKGETEGDWLAAVAGQHDHDALQVLRAAITHT